MFFIFNLMALRIALLLFLASHLSVSVTSRSFTIENKCDFTIWPATYNYQGSVDTTGFILEKGEKRTINTTSSWKGYLWGRTLCSRDSSAGYFSCITGDCDSGNIECSKEAVPPATLAEFNLVSDGGNDYYDVSVINGYNLPVLVTPENGLCKSIGCDIDIKKTCPTELWMPDIKSNDPYACRTSCQKNQTRELCCVGHYQEVGIPPQECKRTIYSETFNRTCPGAYSYAYDSNSSTFTCPYSSNFVIQFCPGPNRTTNNRIPKTGAGEKGKSLLKLILIIGGSSVFAMIIIIAIVIKAKANDRRKSDWDGKNIEAVVMLKRFSYVQVKKMTKSFADVLGRGGFGTGEIMSFFEEQITEEDDEILVRKMVLVGLWCIQTNPFDRPSMSKVVEMLEGSPEALRIPPKPLLSIPAITVQGSAGEVQDTSSQDISLYSEEAVQEITEEHSLRSS
ncbi:hypothetical protein HID58_063471 [Brassica napus]|uniref:Uncharacterized protein n=1 Tax=Brassica napus TaxID=3708 RepID=A0ABQ8A4C7_BRANA|nr:hypothetical protein HID58_063471 [Brassica napus]